LTGGGDCPGLNAVIRAVVRRADALGYQTIGILEGWRGLLENKLEPLTLERVSGILYRGGTILRTSRTNPFKRPNGLEALKEGLKANGIDTLIAVGGDDTMSVADALFQQGVRVVGVPKTIDNDLSGTDYCFGFDTAVNIATDAIDRLHTTAEAHNRVMIVEVMGRDTGWIAVASGLAGGADLILIPEKPVDFDQVCEVIR
jgi:6-phosphofructokinase 1